MAGLLSLPGRVGYNLFGGLLDGKPGAFSQHQGGLAGLLGSIDPRALAAEGAPLGQGPQSPGAFMPDQRAAFDEVSLPTNPGGGVSRALEFVTRPEVPVAVTARNGSATAAPERPRLSGLMGGARKVGGGIGKALDYGAGNAYAGIYDEEEMTPQMRRHLRGRFLSDLGGIIQGEDSFSETRNSMMEERASDALRLSRTAEAQGDLREQQALDAYLNTLPPEKRSEAAMDAKGYASDARKAAEPLILNLGGGRAAAIDRNSGDVVREYTMKQEPPSGFTWDDTGNLKPIPGGPADPDYIAKTAGDRAAAVREAAPPVSLILGDRGGGSGRIDSTGDVMGPIYGKIARGEPLTPGEERLYSDSRRPVDPYAALLAGGGGGYDMPPPAAAPRPAATPARTPPAEAITFLRSNPSLKADFDRKYGAGSADRYLKAKR